MAGAPTADHEAIYTTWLALGGATAPGTGVAPVVAGGVTAAVVHAIGDFLLDLGTDLSLVAGPSATRCAATNSWCPSASTAAVQ